MKWHRLAPGDYLNLAHVVRIRVVGNEVHLELTGSIHRIVCEDAEAVARALADDPKIQVFIEGIRSGTQEIGTLFGFVERQATQTGEAMARSGQDTTQFFVALERQLDRVREALVQALGPGRAAEIDAAMNGLRARVGGNLDRLKEKATKTWDDVAVSGVQAFASTVSDGIVDMVADGKQSFNELAASFAKTIAKMILEFATLQLVVTAFRAAGFNPVGLQGIPGLMSGGPVTAGQPYIVGERQPELFVPGSSGYIYPNVGSSGGMQIIVNQNAPGVVVDAQQADEQTVMLSVNIARQQAAEDFRRSTRNGYGPYAEALNQQYQLRRRLS